MTVAIQADIQGAKTIARIGAGILLLGVGFSSGVIGTVATDQSKPTITAEEWATWAISRAKANRDAKTGMRSDSGSESRVAKGEGRIQSDR